MTTSPTPKKVKEPAAPKGPPNRWGTSSARFYAAHEGESIRVHFENGEVLTGILIELDLFDIFIQRDGVSLLITNMPWRGSNPRPLMHLDRVAGQNARATGKIRTGQMLTALRQWGTTTRLIRDDNALICLA